MCLKISLVDSRERSPCGVKTNLFLPSSFVLVVTCLYWASLGQTEAVIIREK